MKRIFKSFRFVVLKFPLAFFVSMLLLAATTLANNALAQNSPLQKSVEVIFPTP